MDYFVYLTAILYIFFIVLESYLSRRDELHLYDLKDSGISLWLGLGGLLMDLTMKGVTFGILNKISVEFALVHIESKVYYWIGIFVAQDFCFYWLHRTEHYCRFFWAVHVNHHSSEKFNFTVALRSSALQPLYRWIFFIPCALLGFNGIDIMFIYAVNQTYAFFVHTETVGKLGILEKFLVTPSHHRVHHASNVQYLDKNMGQVLILWDKLFGTFAEETDKPVYGLTKNVHSYHLAKVIFHEWNHIFKDIMKPVSLSHKLRYLFAPPGWSHDGSSKTSAQLRKEMKK